MRWGGLVVAAAFLLVVGRADAEPRPPRLGPEPEPVELIGAPEGVPVEIGD